MKIATREVVCPECGHRQQESVSAISSYCRKCSAHLDLEKVPVVHEQVVYRTKVDRRRVQCRDCGHLNFARTLDSYGHCEHCGAYYDLRDYRIQGGQGQPVDTHGAVVIEKRGRCHHQRLRARHLEAAGQVSGDLLLEEGIRLLPGAEVHAGRVVTPEITLAVKTRLEAETVAVSALQIRGNFRATRLVAGHVLVEETGCLEVAELLAPEVDVIPGGQLKAERLRTRLSAEERASVPARPPAPSATADPPAG
ncbi:MAG: polymer-forming cytoskeletal protein [Verrucomicrobiota bacterium]